jgi:predicted nucleic acid-binding protein
MVIADTSVWINAQRLPESHNGREFWSLFDRREILMVGPVFAELLQGSRTQREFDTLLSRFNALDYLEVDLHTWQIVARIRRHLSKQGNQIGFADTITAALSIEHDIPLFTLDGDFMRVPNLRFYRPVAT